MSTNSYTLADNTTVTVTATANGVEFNEGMGALTKAIKAKITASSGGASNGLLNPNLRSDDNRILWEGNGVCTIYNPVDNPDPINSSSPASKVSRIPAVGLIYLLESDGTYARDWFISTP